jgi:hypothetical protein
MDGITVTPLTLPAKGLVASLCWGNQRGSVLFTVDDKGILRRLLVPSFQETHKLDLERRCANLVLSGAGLVAALADVQEVWVLDPGTLRVLKKINVPGLRQVAGSPNLTTAVAGLGDGLTVIDLQTGNLDRLGVKGAARSGFDNPVMTPDGKYVFTRGGIEQLHRFRVTPDGLELEDSSPRIAQGAIRGGIQVSPDSKYVCLPTGGGNYGVAKDHPPHKPYSTYIYPVEDLKKPAFAIHQGAYPQVVGFDPVARKVYGQNGGTPLIIFGAAGVRQEEHKLSPQDRNVRQFLVHPDGGRLLLLSDANLLWVELGAR